MLFEAVGYLVNGARGVLTEWIVRADRHGGHPLLGRMWSVSAKSSGEPRESRELNALWQHLDKQLGDAHAPTLLYFPTDRAVAQSGGHPEVRAWWERYLAL